MTCSNQNLKKKHDLKLTFTEIMGEMELILSYPQDARKHQVITFVEALQNASLGPLLVSVGGICIYIYICRYMYTYGTPPIYLFCIVTGLMCVVGGMK